MKRLSLSVVLGIVLAGAATVSLAARNSSGNFSLPSGNPVVSGTAISASSFNGTMSELAQGISDSADRLGRGGFLAAVRGVNGTADLPVGPAFSFTNDPRTGVFLVGASNPAMSVAGTKREEWNTTGALINGTLGVSGLTTLTGAATVGGTLGVTGLATLTGGAALGAPITGMTRASLPAVGQQVSASSGVFSTSSASFVDVTNLTVTLTTTGRPVILNIQSDGAGGASSWGQTGASTGSLFGRLLRDGAEIARWQAYASAQNNQAASYTHLDVGASAAAHTYKVQILAQLGTVVTQYAQLVAYEL